MAKFGELGWGEALFHGVALSANALTNELGAGLFGLSPLVISLTAAIGSYIGVWAGVKLGHKLATVRIGKFGTVCMWSNHISNCFFSFLLAWKSSNLKGKTRGMINAARCIYVLTKCQHVYTLLTSI